MKHRTRTRHRMSVVNGDGHVIGLDVGASAVRAAVLSPKASDGQHTVDAHVLGAVPLPEGAVVDGVVANPGALTAALKQLWDDNSLNCRRVVLGVTSQQVSVRDMTMPGLPADELKKALPYQAREVIALPLDQALLDFAPVGPPHPETGDVTGLLTAIPKAPVVTAVHAVEKAKLTVARVDLAPFGILRSMGTDGPALEAIVDIGAHLATIVIHANGIARVVRVVPQGGHAWTTHLADNADLTADEAEATKRTIGLDSHSQVTGMLRDAVRPLVTELRGSLHFFATQQQVTAERVILTGGGAAMPGLAKYLANELRIQVGYALPLRHISGVTAQATEPTSPTSASAVGLAMGTAA